MKKFEIRFTEIFDDSKIFDIIYAVKAKEEDVKNIAFEICQVLDGLLDKRNSNEKILYFNMQNEIGIIDRVIDKYEIEKEKAIAITNLILHTLVDSYNKDLISNGVRFIIQRDVIKDLENKEVDVNNKVNIKKTNSKNTYNEASQIADDIIDFLYNSVFNEINENIEINDNKDEIIEGHPVLAIKEETIDSKPKNVEYKEISINDNSIYKSKNKPYLNKNKKELTKKQQIKKNNDSSILKMTIFVFVFIILIVIVFIFIGLRKKAFIH